MKILIIGQTPPPYGGQSINIKKIVDICDKHNYNFRFIRMDFSDELSDNGKLAIKKIWRLFKILFKILLNLVVYRPDYVYYPVSGPEKIPVIRDMILLFPIRFFRKKVIYHFHAGGLAEIFPVLGGGLKRVFKFVYFSPDYAICMSDYGVKDPQFLNAKNISLIPYGVTKPLDIGGVLPGGTFSVLFVGVCRESKGIIDFVKIIEIANQTEKNIKGTIVGTIFGDKENRAIKDGVEKGFISYLGVKIGKDKEQVFRQSSLFLFPTFFEHENFPTVNLEAFSFKLPVISTKWRGVNDQIQNGINGFIHNIHDNESMAYSILDLYKSKDLHKQLSENAYKSYLANYTDEKFEENILNFLKSLK